MQEEINLLDSNGKKLFGILSFTDKKETDKIAVLCHGLNSSTESKSSINLENNLLKHGINSLRFDFFAHGKSDGAIEERTVEKFVDNIVQVVKFVQNKGFTKIALCGSSFGGLSAVIAATKLQSIKVLVLKAPGMGQNSRTLSNYINDFNKKTWIVAGKNITIPTLIIHGTNDESVEPIFAQELADNIKGSKLHFYEKADHSFSNKNDFKKSNEEIAKFIYKNI
jgi:uncharacterized protein